MDNYVPNDQRIVNVEDDFIVALCFDDVADYANALIYMNSVTLVEYTERAEELNEPLALEREEREEQERIAEAEAIRLAAELAAD